MRLYGEPQMVVHGLSPAVKIILFSTVGVFLLQVVLLLTTGMRLSVWFALSRSGLLDGQLWRLVSYIFLHDPRSIWHILLNMLMLFIFGREIEGILGTRRFMCLYLGCGILAGLGWLIISGRASAYCIGASGAVFGILGTFAALFPARRITLLLFFVLPVTMSARTMAMAMGAISLFSLMGGDGNIAHAAHLAGGVVGYIYGRRLLRPQVRREDWFGRPTPEDRPPPIPAEVDRVLEKISARGIGSLSRAERDVLDRASRKGRG